MQQTALLAPVRVTLGVLARAAEDRRGDIGADVPALISILDSYPQLAAMRIGFNDGGMLEAVPDRSGAITGSEFIVRILTLDAAGSATEHLRYVDRGGVERGRTEPTPASFDPRTQHWYAAAVAAAGRTVETMPYRILRSTTPGLSAVTTFGGDRGGVIAADIPLSQFSLPLENLATEPGEQMFLFTGDGRLFANADFSTVVGGTETSESVELNPVDTLSHPAARALLAIYRDGEQPFSTRSVEAEGESYLASVTPIGPTDDPARTQPIYFAFAMPERTFTGAFIAIGQDAVLISLGIMLFSVPLIVLVARRVARPLSELSAATDRIAQLDLTAPVAQPTRIREIARLGDSLDRMKSALGQMAKYVPKSLVQDLISSGVKADIGGDRREMSFMFTDVRDFTPMAEAMPAEDLMSQMSTYFDGLVADILARNGTVDKYVGDAIFAYWNAPLRQANHAELACLAALACRSTSNRLNDEWRRAGRPEWYTRLGVHLGDAVVGNVGSCDRMDYTVVGNAVNIASRLEGLNKYYGTQVLISGEIADRVGDHFVMRYLDTAAPKGAGAPLRIFELLGSADDGPVAAGTAGQSLREAWVGALKPYQRRDWPAALAALKGFLANHPNDGPAQTLLQRVESFLKSPPPPDWDGITRFDSK